MMAEKLGTSHAHMSELERGVVILNQPWMKRIAQVLGVKPADLLNADENSDSLSPDERQLIERYRIASPDQREQISRMADVIVPWKGPTSDAA